MPAFRERDCQDRHAMNKHQISKRSRASEAGFSIVELMVSIAIGIVIVLAMVGVLIKSNRNNAELIKSNKLIDGAKAASFLIEQDLTHASYWGGFIPGFDDLLLTTAPGDVPDAVTDPCGVAYPPIGATADQDKKNLIGISVQVYPIAVVGGAPASPVCTSVIRDPVPGSDVLVVRYADRAPSPTADGNLMIQVDRCGSSRPAQVTRFRQPQRTSPRKR